MIIVKSKRQQKMMSKLGYNSNKRIQIKSRFGSAKSYINNFKNQFITLGNLILAFVISPFLIVYQLGIVILNLNYWCLIYTKKILEEGGAINASFKNPNEDKIELHFDKPEDIF